MPYLHITSNADVAHEEKQLCLAACSKVLAETLGKSTQYLMTAWADAAMDLGESAAPTAFIEIRGLRLPDDACEQLSPKLCEAIQSTVEIHPERIFINVQDIAPKDGAGMEKHSGRTGILPVSINPNTGGTPVLPIERL